MRAPHRVGSAACDLAAALWLPCLPPALWCSLCCPACCTHKQRLSGNLGLRLRGCRLLLRRQVRRTSGRRQHRHRGPGGQARCGPGSAEPADAGACLLCCCLSVLVSLVLLPVLSRSRSRALPGSASVGRLLAAADALWTWTALGSAQSIMSVIVMGSTATVLLWFAGAGNGSQQNSLSSVSIRHLPTRGRCGWWALLIQ